MQIAHVHIYVSNRPNAVEWFRTAMGVNPDAEDHEMSLFTFGSTQLVINDVEEDILSTIAFSSEDCDQDYAEVIAKGVSSIHEPEDKPWGVRAAFVQGPGRIIIEFEERLPS